MNWLEEFPSMLADLINSPRLFAAVGSTTAALGALSFTEIIHGAFSGFAVLAGTAATVLLARNHIIEFKNKKLQNQILRHQVKAIGETPDV